MEPTVGVLFSAPVGVAGLRPQENVCDCHQIGKAMMDRADDVVLVRDFRMPRNSSQTSMPRHVGLIGMNSPRY